MVHQFGSEAPLLGLHIAESKRQMLALVLDSVPAVIYFFVAGALMLATAVALVTRRLRTAAELNVTRFALDWVFALATCLFFPRASALFLPAHLSLPVVLDMCLTLWLWCARSVERESLETSTR